MTPEDAREAMMDAAVKAWWREDVADDAIPGLLDLLADSGFSISLDSVRDHTNCRKDGAWPCIDGMVCGHVIGCGDRPCSVRIPCGGSPVVWSTEP